MANKLYQESVVQSIADAIRVKNGLTTQYKIGDMPAAILAIPQGGTGVNYLPTVLNDATSYTLPAEALTGVTNIRSYSFYGAKITSIVFPAGLTTIGEYAFQNSLLTSVDLPSSVTFVGQRAFDSIQTNTFILRPTTPPTLESNCFGVPATAIGAPYIYVPDASLSAYRSSNPYYGQHFYALSELSS